MWTGLGGRDFKGLGVGVRELLRFGFNGPGQKPAGDDLVGGPNTAVRLVFQILLRRPDLGVQAQSFCPIKSKQHASRVVDLPVPRQDCPTKQLSVGTASMIFLPQRNWLSEGSPISNLWGYLRIVSMFSDDCLNRTSKFAPRPESAFAAMACMV